MPKVKAKAKNASTRIPTTQVKGNKVTTSPRRRGTNANRAQIFEYDVCLSFAGEDRAYVNRVAKSLRAKGIRVFYDDNEQASL